MIIKIEKVQDLTKTTISKIQAEWTNHKHHFLKINIKILSTF